MLQEHGLTPNTFTYGTLIEGCNFKGRGEYDVAMVMYAKLLQRQPVPPDYIKTALLRVVVTAMKSASSLQEAMKAFLGLQHLCLENSAEVPSCPRRQSTSFRKHKHKHCFTAGPGLVGMPSAKGCSVSAAYA